MGESIIEACTKSCIECYKACSKAIQHCLDEGGDQASPEHISMMQDCAEICKVAADFMLRDSEFARDLCELAAEVCKACAKDCAEFADDETMANFALICERCATDCRQM